MIANAVEICLLELYTWKTFVGIMLVLLLMPIMIKLIEKIFDWWYWRKRKK